MRVPPPFSVDAQDAWVLRGWSECAGSTVAAVRRARIVLLSGAGLGPTAIADELGCSKQTVITWRERYRVSGIAGLRDAPRSGRPARVSAADILTRTLQPPPAGAARWTTRLMGAEVGVSNVSVANAWRAWGITPGAAGRVELGTDPVLDGHVGAVEGLYVAGAVRVLALRAGPSVTRDAILAQPRPDIGERLAALASEMRPDNEPDLLPAAFLARLEDRHGPAEAVGATALMVEGATERLRCWAASRAWATLHVVPPNLSWARIARVACLLAGAREPGAASVAALRGAVDAHRPGAALSWVYAP